MILTSRLVILLSATARPLRPAALFHCKNSTIRPGRAEGAISTFEDFQRCRDSWADDTCARDECGRALDISAPNCAKGPGILPQEGASGLTFQARAGIDRRSRRISRAALCPGTAPTPPPGCAEDPHW